MNRFGVFSPEDAREIHRKVLGQQPTSSPENIQRRHTTSADMYYVKMLADLPAATNPETGYTQADGLIVRYKIPAEDTLDREVAPDTAENREKITNRSTSFSAKTGDYIWVKRAGSEYIPLHSGGGQNSPSDVCPCFCIEEGNLSVNGVETVVQYTVTLGALEWKYEHGTINLSAGQYIVTWVPSRQLWVLDIGENLTASFNDGTSATNLTTMDGEITLSFPASPAGTGDCCIDAELNVCVDGIIPQPEGNVGVVTGFQYGYENGYIDGAAGNPYDDRVIFAGSTGTAAGTGQYQQFGTGTNLEPATGTYGDMTGTGTGTGTFMWSDYEEGFYTGYRKGYYVGYADGQASTGIGTAPGTGTSPGAGTGGQFE